MKALALALLLYAGGARALCDSVVLSGFALHGDRTHDYNAFTKGVGCRKLFTESIGAEVVVFENSNFRTSVCGVGAWAPVVLGRLRAGAALGACTGYRPQQLLPAGGFTLALERDGLTPEMVWIPRVLGMKGDVKWFRIAVPNWEPLK